MYIRSWRYPERPSLVPAVSESDAQQFADLGAWNSHDLDAIMSHYMAPAVVLTSPIAARLLDDPSGTVTS